MAPAIQTRGLTMDYQSGLFGRRRRGLDGLDLDVLEGSIFGFLGPNGAGKTTTIKLLVGLMQPTAGQAFIFGEDARRTNCRRQLGYLPENPYFYEYLTGLEAMDFYGTLCGMKRQERRKRSVALLELFGLGKAQGVRLRAFSKGMRQRLGLAQAMLHDPPLLLLDEPMAGLDPFGRRDIREEIVKIRDRGKTVFFSSHILSDVQDICDQVAIIHQGRLQACGVLSALLEQKVKAVDLAFEGLPPEAGEAFAGAAERIWFDGSRLYFRLPDQQVAEEVIRALEPAGGKLRLLSPHTESLEEYFMRQTETQERAGSGR